MERKNRLRLLHFGELGDCEIVEMLGIVNNEPKRIFKTKFKELRPQLHPLATEWHAWDQVIKYFYNNKNFLNLESTNSCDRMDF